jgi:hypothetical protein
MKSDSSFLLSNATTIAYLLFLTTSASAGTAAPGGVKCTLEKVKDSQSNMVAFTYFVPEGWVAHSAAGWTNPGQFGANLSASTPDKKYSADQLERAIMSYSHNSAGTNKGIRIEHATDFLRAFLEQVKRQYNVSDVNIVDEANEPMPLTDMEKDQASRNWGPMQTRSVVHEAGFIKATFDYNGQEETVFIGTTVAGTNSRMHQLNNPNNELSMSGVFAVGPTTCLVAPSNPSAQKMKELEIAASSFRETPQFLEYWREVNTKLAAAQLGANAAALQYKNATWHERSMAAFRDQMAAKDANTHQFCNYIQNQQDYKTRTGETVALPASYKHVWGDQNGNFLLNDDPTVDLRGYGSGDWKALERAP